MTESASIPTTSIELQIHADSHDDIMDTSEEQSTSSRNAQGSKIAVIPSQAKLKSLSPAVTRDVHSRLYNEDDNL